MPPNKPRDAQTNPTRPLMPTLASSRNIKSPVTPRLAATPSVAKAARSNIPGNIKSPTTREELTTPAKAFVASNVTPRSSSRKSRVGSNNTTPTGTPVLGASTPTTDTVTSGGRNAAFQGLGLGITASGNTRRPNSLVNGAQSPLSPSLVSQSRLGQGSSHGSSMFFRANDVRTSPDLPATTSKRSPVFVYANGQQDKQSRPTSAPSPPLSSVSTRSRPGKFLHANGKGDDDVASVPLLPSPSVSTSVPQLFQSLPGFRPPSPNKETIHLTYRKGASQILRPKERPKTVAVLPPTGIDAIRKRSTSGGASPLLPHKRTSSLSSIESGASARKPSGGALETYGLTPLQTVLTAVNSTSPEPTSASSSARLSEPIPEDSVPPLDPIHVKPTLTRHMTMPMPSLPVPQSPTKTPGDWQPQLAEAIVNARVERKIQDLEISNSSLMAINKSLEREVRRQKQELRRFRRLSRAGHLSNMTIGEPIGTDGEDQELSMLERLSEEDEDEEEYEEQSSDESSSGDSGALSSSNIAERDEKKLAKDSKRLQLDLAKHREILVDSQKMNQSLRRCMVWTEMMIKDGRKALDYKADPEPGGRILDSDEYGEKEVGGARDDCEFEAEEDAGPRHSLLSPWTPSPISALEALDGILGIDTAMHTRKSWQSEEGVDSGVEVESRPHRKAVGTLSSQDERLTRSLPISNYSGN